MWFGEISVRGNVRSGNCPFGELSVRGTILRGTVRRGNIFGELSFVKNFVGKISAGNCPRAVFRKRCFENMQQIYRKTTMSKCDLE